MSTTFARLNSVIALIAISMLLTGCDGRGTPSVAVAAADAANGGALPLTVYKSPTCGCCVEWIDHLNPQAFSTLVKHPADLDRVKEELGVGLRYRSCHTAVTTDGYVFEGHVPEKFMRRFLAGPPPDALGLAVPGMPLGSPGMEVDDHFNPYQILLLHRDGSASVYAEIDSYEAQFD